jgi:hypothetical protein
VNAPTDQRTRLATSAVSQATFPVIAPTHLPKALVVEVVDSNLAVAVAVAVDLRSATRHVSIPNFPQNKADYSSSAPRLAISLVTAQRLVDTVVEDMVVTREHTEAGDLVVDAKVDRLATLAVDTATCLVCLLPHPILARS